MSNVEDRELLELAAKAAGMFVLPKPWPEVDGWFFCVHHDKPAMHFRKLGNPHAYSEPWMPLTDDGDALRLAVKLCIETSPRAVTVAAHHWRGSGSIDHETYSQEHYSDSDPNAATRRAIVRAAAQIGRTA